MEQYRQSTQAANIEEHWYGHDDVCDHDDNHVSALETLGGHRNMGHWELSHLSTAGYVPHRATKTQKTHDQIMDDLVAKNPFHALSDAGHEESMPPAGETPKTPTQSISANQTRRTWKVKQPTETDITTSVSLSEYPWITKVSQGTRKKWKRRMAIMPSIVEDAELSNIDTGCGYGPSHQEGQSGAMRADMKRVELTIDSGAAEHVVGPKDLPHIPIGPSRKHVQYTMANGQKT